ncbi:hypothetical protein SDC9_142318 [bioreactor metagenome]|uniref:Uncharacterized protein n=1 Tax=bioreactor metagenome TaxID=1076179 RepID=A0A645E0J0_9ZZZZ
MTNHGGLSNNGLGNGFHGQIANNRRGFVKPNFRQLTDTNPGFPDSFLQSNDDAWNIGRSSFYTGGFNNTAGQILSYPTSFNSGQTNFSCGIADIHTSDDRH